MSLDNILDSFPDKKNRSLDFDELTDILKLISKTYEDFDIGQKEATWIPQSEYPNVPIGILLMSDVHYGSINISYDLLEKHISIIETTPNMYICTNGDLIDNFNPFKHPSGMIEDPISPTMQARSFLEKILELDRSGKIGCLAHGNHENFFEVSGHDFYESFMGEFYAPIFNSGPSMLNIVTHGAEYNMVMNHTYWGRSKLNITNAAKRLIEYEGAGRADIGWLGHTHQSSYEHFTKGPKELVAIVSGTYKMKDKWAGTRGIGGRAGNPGITLVLWQDRKKIEVFKDVSIAKEYIESKLNSE